MSRRGTACNGHEIKTSCDRSMSNIIEFKEDSLFDDDGISLFASRHGTLSACLNCAESYRNSVKSRACCVEK